MGRHTAPIPVATPPHGVPSSRRVTDPRLLDRPTPPEDGDSPARHETGARPWLSGSVPARAEDDDGIDEGMVDLAPRSASSVLRAEVAASTSTPNGPRRRPARALELAFAAVGVLALAVAIAAAFIQR